MRYEQVKRKAEQDAKSHGYFLNPDPDQLRNLLEGLAVNERRLGYQSCPCRFASGNFGVDRDIICPCDYRDPDVAEFGSCYCCLYVDKDTYEGKTPMASIPERRPIEKQTRALTYSSGEDQPEKIDDERVLMYCRVCGYVTYREDPPYVCPICRAKREMFSDIKKK